MASTLQRSIGGGQQQSTGASGGASTTTNAVAAIPTLRVMRLQSPELYIDNTTSTDCVLRQSLCLPDNLIVYVGETFTAYLGILNSSHTSPIYKLNISAQLQTPTQRYQLPCALQHQKNQYDEQQQQQQQHEQQLDTTVDSTTKGGRIGSDYNSHSSTGSSSSPIDVPAASGVDTIVSKRIEESGQHILRIEVGYSATATSISDTPSKNSTSPTTKNAAAVVGVGMKTFRKFYRFHVLHPFRTTIEHIYRTIAPDNKNVQRCYVSVSTDFSSYINDTIGGGEPITDTPTTQIVITSVQFESIPNSGLIAQNITNNRGSATTSLIPNKNVPSTTTAMTTSNTTTTTTEKPYERTNRKSATQLFDTLFGNATNYDTSLINNNNSSSTGTTSTRIMSNSRYRYLFQLDAIDKNISIVAGDTLGKVCFHWCRAMGESGIIYTSPIVCPNLPIPIPTKNSISSTTTTTLFQPGKNNNNNNNCKQRLIAKNSAGSIVYDSFVVHQSGFVNDIRVATTTLSNTNTSTNKNNSMSLSYSKFLVENYYGITIEPINPPKEMKFGIPTTIQFTIINHTTESVTIQLQFRDTSTSTSSAAVTNNSTTLPLSSSSSSLQVCGITFQNIIYSEQQKQKEATATATTSASSSSSSVPPNGGTVQATVSFIPLQTTGLIQVDGCYIVDLVSGREIQQPPLFYTYVVQ